jgi:hypothetical protein
MLQLRRLRVRTPLEARKLFTVGIINANELVMHGFTMSAIITHDEGVSYRDTNCKTLHDERVCIVNTNSN